MLSDKCLPDHVYLSLYLSLSLSLSLSVSFVVRFCVGIPVSEAEIAPVYARSARAATAKQPEHPSVISMHPGLDFGGIGLARFRVR